MASMDDGPQTSAELAGYAGRVGLFEVMPIRGQIRSLVERSTEEIFAAAVEQGMTTMRRHGITAAQVEDRTRNLQRIAPAPVWARCFSAAIWMRHRRRARLRPRTSSPPSR